MVRFNCVLLEKELDDAISKCELMNMIALFEDNAKLISIEVQSEYSTAIGFITLEAAESIDYKYLDGTEFYNNVYNVLSDMENEVPEGIYDFNGINTLITRNI